MCCAWKTSRRLSYGASGSIGTAAVQPARHFEADVTAVCNTKNVETVRSLGADRVIDYTAEDLTANGQAYDVIYDAVGKHSFGRCESSLKPGGIYLATDGFGSIARSLLTSRSGRKRVALQMARYAKKDAQFLGQLSSWASSSRQASITRSSTGATRCRTWPRRPGTSRRSKRPGTSCSSSTTDGEEQLGTGHGTGLRPAPADCSQSHRPGGAGTGHAPARATE